MVQSIYAFDYVTGDTLYPYSTQAQPAKGASYVDGRYNTTVTRITSSVADRGSWGTGAGYSTWTPISSNGQYLIFMNLNSKTDGGPYVCYNAADNTYNATISGYLNTYLGWWNSQDPEPRWDESGSHPTWLYYRKDMQLRYLDVATGSDNLVHNFAVDFPTYSSYYIYNGEEGSSSFDSRYWAFIIKNPNSPYQAVRVFTYDKTTDTVIASKNISGNEPNNVMMSQSGNYIYVAYDWTGAGNEFDGPHTYTRTFTNPQKVCSGIPHAVWAYDVQGREVVFFMNTAGEYADHVCFVRADNGAVYALYDQANLGWDGSNLLHTAPNSSKKGWGLISTYSQYTSGGGGNNHWSDNQIFFFELDETKTVETTPKPRIWRVSFTQNQVGDDYYFQQPNAQISRDGTKIWWGANWRSDSGRSEIYRADLPATWWEDLGLYPYVDGYSPAKDAIGVSSNTNIEVHIKDALEGVDVSSIHMKVNGHSINPIITGTLQDYMLYYVPEANFPDNQVVAVTVDAQDLAIPPNVMPQVNYSFTIGIASVSPSIDKGGSAGGGEGGGCFIATAAYGTDMQPELLSLYKFRNKFLLTNPLGRAFIKYYYKNSPPLAKFIKTREWARSLVKVMLRPMTWVSMKITR